VKPEDKLWIDNSFGNVVVNTWDKEQITVDIEIGARAPSEEKAAEIMNKIAVKDSQQGHNIYFKTNVDNIQNGRNGKRDHSGEGDQRSFYIDYVIHMPESNQLDLQNSFGKTEVPDFKGGVSLTSKFGSLNTGALQNVDMIDVEFGACNISAVNNGKVAFKYNGQSHIGRVSGSVKITSEFSSNVRIGVTDDIKELSVFESYSEMRVIVDKELSAEFDVHTNFGNFHNESDFSISKKEEEGDGPHFDSDYSGKAGDGKARIKIKDSFGSVRLTYVSERDRDRDKDRNKRKDKDKDDDSDKDDDGR
jgi:hypothetical protein